MFSSETISTLCEIETLCYPDTIAYDTETMQEILNQPGTLLICEWREGTLAGFQLSDRLRGTIITIDVHPSFRRQGIARLLMIRSLQTLKASGHKRVISEVAVDNIPSLLLHLKLGFKKRFTLKHYYGTGQNAYRLVLEFKKSNKN